MMSLFIRLGLLLRVEETDIVRISLLEIFVVCLRGEVPLCSLPIIWMPPLGSVRDRLPSPWMYHLAFACTLYEELIRHRLRSLSMRRGGQHSFKTPLALRGDGDLEFIVGELPRLPSPKYVHVRLSPFAFTSVFFPRRSPVEILARRNRLEQHRLFARLLFEGLFVGGLGNELPLRRQHDGFVPGLERHLLPLGRQHYRFLPPFGFVRDDPSSSEEYSVPFGKPERLVRRSISRASLPYGKGLIVWLNGEDSHCFV
mmetsp:Transcript_3261/g.6251  ORF Transcript_3261/g.6251 Transcript_3261/m.6251 type:complete len:256 (+) Transcript_3261:1626-2393(+)